VSRFTPFFVWRAESILPHPVLRGLLADTVAALADAVTSFTRLLDDLDQLQNKLLFSQTWIAV